MNTISTDLLGKALAEQLADVKIGPAGSGVRVASINAGGNRITVTFSWPGPLGEEFTETRELQLSPAQQAPAYPPQEFYETTAHGDTEAQYIEVAQPPTRSPAVQKAANALDEIMRTEESPGGRPHGADAIRRRNERSGLPAERPVEGVRIPPDVPAAVEQPTQQHVAGFEPDPEGRDPNVVQVRVEFVAPGASRGALTGKFLHFADDGIVPEEGEFHPTSSALEGLARTLNPDENDERGTVRVYHAGSGVLLGTYAGEFVAHNRVALTLFRAPEDQLADG